MGSRTASRSHEEGSTMSEPTSLDKAQLVAALRENGDEVASMLRALPPEVFEAGRYESGWNGRQILAHVASIEWTYPRLIDLARQPAPADGSTRAAGGDVHAYNARQVERREIGRAHV